MHIELKNWMGVVILLCVGFVVGRITVPHDVEANPQASAIGRYQLVAGVYTNEASGEQPIQTVFRIDTETGQVERWSSFRKYFTDPKDIQRMGGNKWIMDIWSPCIDRDITPDSVK